MHSFSMSGIQRRLTNAQRQIESLLTDDPEPVTIRTGPITWKKVFIRNEEFKRSSRGGHAAGNEVFGFTFKDIPEVHSGGPEAVHKVENTLRLQYPKYIDAVIKIFEYNNMRGDVRDPASWSHLIGGTSITQPEFVPDDIFIFIKLVTLTPLEARKTADFSQWLLMNIVSLEDIHKGYDAFKRIFFDVWEIKGQFEDILSWNQLDPDDNLQGLAAPKEIKGFFKALGRQSDFYVFKKGTAIKLRGETVSKEQIRQTAKKMWAIRALISRGPKGLLINDDRRLLLYLYFVCVVVLITFSATKTTWMNGPFEVAGSLLTLLVSIPALWTFMSSEQDPVWAALRGQRYLYDDQDVMKTFSINELEVAIYGLVDGGCPFLSNERMCHNPDKGTDLIKRGPEALTTTKELRKVGILIGHHMARRIWEKNNYTVIRNENQELYITEEISTATWCTGVRTEMRVG